MSTKEAYEAPHSRACGWRNHDHGAACHPNCPTCHGGLVEHGAILAGYTPPSGGLTAPSIWAEVQAERERAHVKHGDTSMEALPVHDLTRLTVLMEEVGEVAREFNEARHRGVMDLPALRKELIQVTAMAGAWADALGPLVLSTSGDKESV